MIGVLFGTLGLVVMLLVAPAGIIDGVLSAFDGARSALGRDPLGWDDPLDLGYDLTCPQNKPFRCENGTCVLNPSMCDPEGNCPDHLPFLCVDGTCSDEPNGCVEHPECPGVTPYQCPTGGCVPAPSECGDELPETAPTCPDDRVVCPDNTCAPSLEECPIPPQPEPPLTAPEGEGCPTDAPFQCTDGTCVVAPENCDPGPVAPPPEPTDPPPDDLTQPEEPEVCEGFLCEDGRCVETRLDCVNPTGPTGPGDLTSG